MATNTNVEKIVAKIETEVSAEAAERRSEASEMREALADAKAALIEAEKAPDALLKAAGDGAEVTPAELAEANAAIELGKARVAGLTERLSLIAKNTTPERPDAAALLVPTFRKILVGVPIIPTVVPSARVIAEVKGAEGPAVVLCQESETKHLGDGMVSASKVVAVFVRPTWAADLPVADLEEAARKDTVAMTVRSNFPVGNYQTLAISIEGAAEEVPLIREIDSLGVNGGMQTFGARVMYALGEYPQVPTVQGGVLAYQGAYGRMNLSKPKVTEAVNDKGVRTTTLAFDCHIHAGGREREFVMAAPRLVAPEGFQSNLGRLTGVDVVDSTDDPRSGTVSQRVTLSYVSRVK